MSEEWGYSILKEKLLENKELYGDKDFPPSLISITFDGKITEDFPVSEITWKRPKVKMCVLCEEVVLRA